MQFIGRLGIEWKIIFSDNKVDFEQIRNKRFL